MIVHFSLKIYKKDHCHQFTHTFMLRGQNQQFMKFTHRNYHHIHSIIIHHCIPNQPILYIH